MNLLEEIVEHRGKITPGANPNRFVELAGGREVPILFHIPDAETFREKYYYNSRLNSLFLRVDVLNGRYWKKVSEY